jgi:hypothetical protein
MLSPPLTSRPIAVRVAASLLRSRSPCGRLARLQRPCLEATAYHFEALVRVVVTAEHAATLDRARRRSAADESSFVTIIHESSPRSAQDVEDDPLRKLECQSRQAIGNAWNEQARLHRAPAGRRRGRPGASGGFAAPPTTASSRSAGRSAGASAPRLHLPRRPRLGTARGVRARRLEVTRSVFHAWKQSSKTATGPPSGSASRR